MGTSNAVNLTDGLDGLAIGCSISVALTYAIFCYVARQRPNSPPTCSCRRSAARASSACSARRWPARASAFSGSTATRRASSWATPARSRSAACWASSRSACTRNLLLIIAGGVFVLEAGSVLIQVASFKLTGKRVFAMSPLHHHFELKGWDETTVTVRFWIMSLIARAWPRWPR